jgi:hypothetical protein
MIVKLHRAITFNAFFIANSFVKCKAELILFDGRPMFLHPEYFKTPPFFDWLFPSNRRSCARRIKSGIAEIGVR